MKTVAKPKLILAILTGLALVGCGTESNPVADSASRSETSTDLAFATRMAEHHRGAIEMAEVAGRRARHPEIKALAEDISTSQRREVGVLEEAAKRLEAAGTEAADLGLSEDMAGMGHDAAALAEARPFDRGFIDSMVPHHQGAIRMARIELDRGSDGDLRALAEDVIESQSREIEQMNDWRTEWYGKPSPAGGVPVAGEGAGAHEEAGHSGH